MAQPYLSLNLDLVNGTQVLDAMSELREVLIVHSDLESVNVTEDADIKVPVWHEGHLGEVSLFPPVASLLAVQDYLVVIYTWVEV